MEENEGVKGFIDAAGMKSPGLSSAPAIAEEIVNILRDAGLSLTSNFDFDPNSLSNPFYGAFRERKGEVD